MKPVHRIAALAACILLLIVASILYVARQGDGKIHALTETTLEKVKRTQTLRCGYFPYPPVAFNDPASGELKGLFVDVMTAFSSKTGIKVEWEPALKRSTWVKALNDKKIDLLCSPIMPDYRVYQNVKFSRPIAQTELVPVIRAGEIRFGDSLRVYNDKYLTLGVLEGDTTRGIMELNFPRANLFVIPMDSTLDEMVDVLLKRQVDMLPLDRNSIEYYNKLNLAKIKYPLTKKFIKVLPYEFVASARDESLINFLDNTFIALESTGDIKRAMDKWIEPVSDPALHKEMEE